MKKALLSLAFVGALATGANAQLEVGSVAPDFTLTDIEGNEHHLYDYLEQGYTVLIDISAAWCGPCWMAHESGFMKDLYNQYGPEGTIEAGKVMVIFVEGEAANTEAQLHGTSSGSSTATYSQGDWVTGEPYPFIDSDELNDAYNLGGFPTFTLICPNRRVALAVAGYSSAMADVANWLPLIDDCPVPVDGTNIGTIGINTDGIVCAGTPTTLKAEIQNLGTSNLSSATVTAKVDGTTVASTTWSGSLAPYASAIVEIGDYTFTSTTEVEYEVTTTGDVEAGDNGRSGTTTAMSSDYRTWRLEVKTDNYPGEITWRVKDEDGATVESHSYEAGPGEAGAGGDDAMKEFSYVLYLDATKCYTVEVVDDYGDGLYGASSAADTGYIRLKDNTGGMIYNFGAGYGLGYSVIAKTGNTLDIKNVVSVNDTKIYPNPVNDELNVSMNLLKNSAVSFSIVNVVGQQVSDVVVKDMISGQNTTSINTANLAPGMYFLNVTTAEGSFQQKFVKK